MGRYRQRKSAATSKSPPSTASDWARLIRDLFQLTKLEAHELEPQCESFPVAELVQDVVQKFQLAADKRSCTLQPACHSA